MKLPPTATCCTFAQQPSDNRTRNSATSNSKCGRALSPKLPIFSKVSFACLAALVAAFSTCWAQSDADALSVTNGDFSDLTGLQGMANGWYGGVPAGWETVASTEGSTNYAIRMEAGDFVANVAALSQTQPSFAAFEQEVGQVPVPGEVTITFDNKDSWHDPDFSMGAAVYDALTSVPLAFGDFTNAGTHTLVASNVSAGTRLKIGFWSARGFPSLDNVSVSFRPNE
jgi:hypothetical protein